MSDHPSYDVMITKTIKEAGLRGKGASRQVIYKYIRANWKVTNKENTFKANMRRVINNMIENGSLIKINNQRFKLPPK